MDHTNCLQVAIKTHSFTEGVGGAGGVGVGVEVLTESQGGGGRTKGSEGVLPVSENMPVSDALQVSESMSLAEIHHFIRKKEC